MTRMVITEVIKAIHGSNKMGLYSPRLTWLLPLMTAQPDKCRDYCRVFHVALLLGISIQPLGDRPIKYDPFCHGENSNFLFQKTCALGYTFVFFSTVHPSPPSSEGLQNTWYLNRIFHVMLPQTKIPTLSKKRYDDELMTTRFMGLTNYILLHC